VNSNYGRSSTLRTDASPVIRSYLRFTVPPLGGTVTSATLRIYANSTSSIGYAVYSTAGGWGETSITFANAPAPGTALGSSGRITANTWTTIDLTGWVTGGGEVNVVMTSTSNTAISYASRETANPPVLVVVVQGGPPATSTPTMTPSASPTDGPSPTPTATLTPSITPVPSATPTATDIPSIVTLAPVADAYVYASSASTNYGSNVQLRADATPATYSYLRFDLQGMGGSVTRATLRVYANSASSAGYSVRAVADTTWSESGLTYANAPALGSVIGSSGSFSAGTWTAVDVTSLFSGSSLVSLALITPSNTAISFSSREGANPPQLVLEFAGSSQQSMMFAPMSADFTIEQQAATETPTPWPTVTPAPTATETPTLANTPTPVPAPDLQIVESDDPRVLSAGSWTSYDSALASGGRYIFSSGSLADTLTVTFQGTRAEVVYVQHPALGSYVIEIDGLPVQQVITTAPESVFGSRAAIVGLPDGTHTLRVVPSVGTIAIDAFGVDVLIETTPTSAPGAPEVVSTETPTPFVVTATPFATEAATSVATEAAAEAAPTALPTSTPLPAALPWIESFETPSGWTAGEGWQWDALGGHSGAGWVANSTLRSVNSTLSSDRLIDLRGALHPQLSLWLKTALSPVDMFALEISADGDSSWGVVSLSGSLVADWTPLTIDLAPYAGEVIRLRFRLDTTAALPQGAATLGAWVDDLLILDVPQPPTAVPTSTPAPTAVPTSTPLPTDVPTNTPIPTDVPTSTPIPTSTPVPTDVPTGTPVPTDVPTDVPAETPAP